MDGGSLSLSILFMDRLALISVAAAAAAASGDSWRRLLGGGGGGQ